MDKARICNLDRDIDRNLEQIYQNNDLGNLEDVQLLQDITLAVRAAVSALDPQSFTTEVAVKNDTFIKDKEMCKRLMNLNPNSFRKIVSTCNLLKFLGFELRVRGGHHIFIKEDIPESINIQP